MATPLTEAATFDAQVIVPEDGVDDETAASLVSSFQSLANRSRWVFSKLAQLVNGGAMTLAASLDYTISGSSALRFLGSSALVNLADPYVRFGGKVLGQLFSAGQEGMANRKTLFVNTGSGAINVDPDLYDTVFINAVSGARQVILTSSSIGAHIKVVSLVTGYACNLQRPSGGGQIGPDIRFTTGDAFVVEALCCPDGTWRFAGQQPFTL